MEPVPAAAPRVDPKKNRQATRGDYYGLKANTLARDARAKLARIRAKVERLQDPWVEADSMLEVATTRALDAIDALAQQFTESAQYMNEPMD